MVMTRWWMAAFEVLGCYPRRLSTEGDEAVLALRIFGIRSWTCAMSHMLPDAAAMLRFFLAWGCDWIGWLSLVPVLSCGMGGPIRLDLISSALPDRCKPLGDLHS